MGSNKEKQSLIVDTGSSICAMPCKNHCSEPVGQKASCGKHINPWYDLDVSTAKGTYKCDFDDGC